MTRVVLAVVALLSASTWADEPTEAGRHAFAGEVEGVLALQFPGERIQVAAKGKNATTLSVDTAQCDPGLVRRLRKALREDALRVGFKRVECWDHFRDNDKPISAAF